MSRLAWETSSTTEEEFVVSLLGPFPEVLASLSKVVALWLPNAPAVTRLAFGAILAQPVTSVHAGFALIQKYLPVVTIDADGSSDFLYQINRPRVSRAGIDGLRLNRLMKWSVQVTHRVLVTLGLEGTASRTLDEEAACRLELDVNTVPEFSGALPVGRIDVVLQELIELGREIAQRGDVP